MPDKPRDDLSDKQAFLNRLIRLAREQKRDGFVRPDANSILGFLTGTGTEDQARAVRKALLQSEEFRREILDAAQDMESLDKADFHDQEREEPGIKAPDRTQFLQLHKRKAERERSLFLAWPKLQWVLAPRRLVPAAVVGTALVTFLVARFALSPQFAHHDVSSGAVFPAIPAPATWSLVETEVDQGYLERNVTRGAESRQHFLTANEAAYAEMAGLLETTEAGLQPRPVGRIARPKGASRPVLLICEDESRHYIRGVAAYIPLETDSVRIQATAWALVLPSRDLYMVPMTSDTMAVLCSKSMVTTACFAFTYPNAKEQRGIPGFSPEER